MRKPYVFDKLRRLAKLFILGRRARFLNKAIDRVGSDEVMQLLGLVRVQWDLENQNFTLRQAAFVAEVMINIIEFGTKENTRKDDIELANALKFLEKFLRNKYKMKITPTPHKEEGLKDE